MVYPMTIFTIKALFFLYHNVFGWRKYLVSGLIVFLLWSVCTSNVRAEPLLQVVEVAWTDGTTESKNPMTTYTPGTAPSDKPLYLWIKVRGGRKALEKLKEKRRLTIIHKWRYNYFGWYTERIDVSIGRDQELDDEMLKKLKHELDTWGYFDWRTWSKKDNFVTDVYSVTFVDGFDDRLGCSISDSCEMNIRLVK